MNIIVIISDTFRKDHLGCYGNKWIKTPNLDNFAKNSIIFDNAYCASFPTVPARRDIFTGKYTYTYSQWAPLDKNEIVISELLNKAGYVTQLIADTPHFLRDGYDFQRGFQGWEWIRGQENDNYITDKIDIKFPCSKEKLRNPDSTVRQYLRNISLRKSEEDYFVAQTMLKSIHWLEKNYKHEKFFLYIDTFDPHEPWDPPQWYVELYEKNYEGENVIYPRYWFWKEFLTEKELKHCRALYAGEVSLVDHWIGKLIEKIEVLGLWNNTAVFFTTDHGFCHGEHGIIGKSLLPAEGRFSYMPLYEEIAHIPFIAHIPTIKSPKRCKEFVQLVDLMPTILELAGVKISPPLHGKSIIPLLTGKVKFLRDFVVSSPTIIHGTKGNIKTTITTLEGWSLILAGRSGIEDAKETKDVDGKGKKIISVGKYQSELYNLKTDPCQKNNVVSKNQNVYKKIHNRYIKFLEEIGTKEELIDFWR